MVEQQKPFLGLKPKTTGVRLFPLNPNSILLALLTQYRIPLVD